MSFKCGNCGEPQEVGTSPIRRVTQIREKSYMGGGQGWEIVKEVLLCDGCKKRVADAAPASRRGSVLVEYLMLCGASLAAGAAAFQALSEFYAAFADRLLGR